MDILGDYSSSRTSWNYILDNNLYGIDIDPFASDLSIVNIALRSLSKNVKLPEILNENIFCDNSLFFNYSGILKEDKGFDFIIGNPPYVLGDNIEKDEKNKIQSEYNEIYASEADYCYYFIKKGIDLLKEGGRLGFILDFKKVRVNFITF